MIVQCCEIVLLVRIKIYIYYYYMSVVKANKKNFKSLLHSCWSNLWPTLKLNHRSKVRNNLALFPRHGWSIVGPLALLYGWIWTRSILSVSPPPIRRWHGGQSARKAIEFGNQSSIVKCCHLNGFLIHFVPHPIFQPHANLIFNIVFGIRHLYV